MSTISTSTQEYWIGTVLAWAEARLMPPQYDECKRALESLAAVVARAERAERLLKRLGQWDVITMGQGDGPYWKREIDAALASQADGGGQGE